MVTPGLHPAVPTLLAEASGNPPLMRQTCWARSRGDTPGFSPAHQGNSSLPMAPSDPSSWTSVIGTHIFVCAPIGVLASAISPLLAPPAVSETSVRQALQRHSGPQLLAYWLQSDDLPDPEFADCDQGLAFDRALGHAVSQHRERVEPPESVDMT